LEESNFRPIGRKPIFEASEENLSGLLMEWRERQKSLESCKVKVLEWSFDDREKDGVKTDPPFKVKAKSGVFYLKGRVDRIDEEKGELIVRDYKRSYNDKYKVKDDSPLPLDDYPLAMYCLAAESFFKLPARGILEFIDCKDKDAFIEVPVKDKNFLSTIWDDIQEGVLEKPENLNCDYCQFWQICRGWQDD
jgi:RecB family exonuclease